MCVLFGVFLQQKMHWFPRTWGVQTIFQLQNIILSTKSTFGSSLMVIFCASFILHFFIAISYFALNYVVVFHIN